MGASLSPHEAAYLLSFLTARDGVCLVGGQAVGLWAMILDPDETHLAHLMPYTTSDIDYFGSVEAARVFAARSGGKLFRPSSDTMNSNSSALVEIRMGGRPVVVDFLQAIIGAERREIEAHVIEVAISDQQGSRLAVPVISPYICLRSRIANMISAATRRRDAISVNQAHASVKLMELWIRHLIANEERRAAMQHISSVVDYVQSDYFGRRAMGEIGIDPLDAIHLFADFGDLDVRWRTMTLGPAIERCESKRISREARISGSMS